MSTPNWQPEFAVDPTLPDEVALIYPAELAATIAEAFAAGLPLAPEHARSVFKVTLRSGADGSEDRR